MRHEAARTRLRFQHLLAALAALIALVTLQGCAPAIRAGQGVVWGAASASPLGAAIGHGVAGPPGLAIGAGLGAAIGGVTGAIIGLISAPPATSIEKEITP